jgi:hypothetical protein
VPNPKFVLAPEAVELPVPPSSTARSVMPVMLPPSMLIDDSATVPATTSAVCAIISRIALLTFDGAIPSSMLMLSMSVFDAAVALYWFQLAFAIFSFLHQKTRLGGRVIY